MFYYERLRDSRWKLEVGNNVDPDDGNSMVCKACRLPIFSTPFVTTDEDDHMHDQCVDDHLPPELKGYPLHPKKDLVLHQQDSTTRERSCSRCDSKCGSRFYACFGCDFSLDLTCALKTRVQHQSHGHRLEAIKGRSSSFLCAACGTQHNNQDAVTGYEKGYTRGTTWDLSYVCSVCDFWIHPECALLPNAIILDKHQHPLLLTYFGQEDYGYWQQMPTEFCCEICDGREAKCFGFYACFHCEYHAHIKCVIYSDPDQNSFKPALLRDAQVPNLLHFPLENEHTSVMPHILTTLLLEQDGVQHEHPLILHEHDDDDDDDGVARVCSACVKLISPTEGPFYGCANNNNNNNKLTAAAAAGPCIDLFLHRCCAHLPATLTFSDLTRLTLVDKMKNPFNLFQCNSCDLRCNGAAYKFEKYGRTFYMDAVCALISSSIITHDAHAKSHIIRPQLNNWYVSKTCNCCLELLDFNLGYECSNCHNFRIHAMCALLPNTINHKFDRHPLKLITTHTYTYLDLEEESKFCEICEKDLDISKWYYYCDKCDQSFHARCIPCVDRLSKIKFGFSVRVEGHNCPLTCVRALAVAGYSCSHCGKTIDEESEDIAFECSECYFRIHEECAENLLLP